ncbi:hypothetical protein [Hymenobacter pini]|uniref:hypothetical protein n=1 Tax=Hymenobacter pini TaxID=2880879 RepID=UPI001CF523C9|nr:hypothetical protein [Hymenobacter pini]MCA8829407.1 hypothetical protein [Hymenobacter pini]
MQTSEQLADLRQLCQENGIDMRLDLWQHPKSGSWIMSKVGAEKLQGRNNIDIDVEVAAAGIDYAIVKVIATRTVKVEGKTTSKKLTVRTLGSANPKTCTQISYYAEMAEKRAIVRAVLKLMGFSKLGVYGEEEADDFARAHNQASPTLEQATEQRPMTGGGSSSAAPALSAGAAPSSAPEADADDFMAIATAIDSINEANTLDELQATWKAIPKQVAEELAVYSAKEERKEHLKRNQTLAA